MTRFSLPRDASVLDRFLGKITCLDEEQGECWVWIAATVKGAPCFNGWGGRGAKAARWSYEHFNGPIPERRDIHQACGNRLCVNPDHLEALTRSENMMRRTKAAQPRVLEPVIDRFNRKHTLDPDTGCWIWSGKVNSVGYGQFSVKSRYVMAHRWSHEHFLGSIPTGLVIDHLCRVKLCVNPAHLEAVTQSTNILRGDRHRTRPTNGAYNGPSAQ